MVGLLIIVGLGLVVLAALLYGVRLESNHDLMDGVEQHPGYQFVPSRGSGLRLPQTMRSPVDMVFTSELDAERALDRAAREHHREEHAADDDGFL